MARYTSAHFAEVMPAVSLSKLKGLRGRSARRRNWFSVAGAA